jgi:starvation-inducible outer membrane lipoprotein
MRKHARTLLLMLAMACAGVALALLLGGCAEPPQRIEGSGEMVFVPALQDYCARYPAECEAGAP